MNVTITPAALGGAVTPPPSKSQAHRLIIAAALSDGVCRLSNVELSQDIQATLRCMRTLDADASADGTVIRGADLVDGFETPPPEIMDCGESGSTLRFLIPVALALKGGGRFTGHGRLMERPQEPYFRLFTEKGIAWSLENGVLAVEGRLTPGVYALPGDVSSQFITGLLYALPLLEGDSELVLTTALESRGYVDMTLDALAQFGVSAEYDGDRRFRVPGNQAYRHRDLAIEGDWSNAAFWFAAAFLGHRVDVEGLNPRSVQGDRVIGEQLARLTQPGPAELDVSQCPDLVPPLAAMAALRAGETTAIVNAARLRIKESDRLASVTQVLNALGAGVEEHADHLVLRGRERLAGGVTVSGHNDHRIVMALAVAAGPGSFTGLRIGVSALKGLAWAAEKPCCGVSTLEAMARNLAHMDALIVCAMDARRNQVYNALFRARGGALERLTPDRAIGIEELAKELADISAETGKIVVGDGAQLCYTGLLERGVSCTLAPAALRMQNAVGVALCAEEMVRRGETTSARDLVPVYLRLSQAERERLAKGLKITVD